VMKMSGGPCHSRVVSVDNSDVNEVRITQE
jgi:hypothetical protein